MNEAFATYIFHPFSIKKNAKLKIQFHHSTPDGMVKNHLSLLAGSQLAPLYLAVVQCTMYTPPFKCPHLDQYQKFSELYGRVPETVFLNS
jgi:hypothetical protein